MKKWRTLFLKEIKDSMTVFSLLFALVAGFEIYAILNAGQLSGMVLSIFPLFIVIAVMPLIMFYLYPQEWKSDARYLLMSLPIPRYEIGVCKFLAVMSAGSVLLLICIVGIYWNSSHFPGWDSFNMNVEITQDLTVDKELGLSNLFHSNFSATGIFLLFSTLYFSLGFVIAIQSVNLIVRRFTFFLTILSGISGSYIYFKFGAIFSSLLSQSKIDYFSLSAGNHSLLQQYVFSWSLYTFLMGFVFLGAGLFLTEKYLEI
ncbi:MAG: hypothetical protein HQM13_09690 [SAR324 cluster bacterium]|nr:hypothetical protein [SAR324 cluster bacterium]